LINFQSGPTVVTWHAFIGPSDVARLISSLLHGPLCLLTRRERNKGREEQRTVEVTDGLQRFRSTPAAAERCCCPAHGVPGETG
jgi:hypothetical protein